MKNHSQLIFLLMLITASSIAPLPLHADETAGLTRGQLVYVPAYSHIYTGNQERPFLLTVTLSIRNIDPQHQIRITTVDYYETQGKLLKKYIEKPAILNPLESFRCIVSERDKAGGSGANFVVEWSAEKLVNAPIVESIMIGAQNQQGISFTSRGRVIMKPKP